MPCSHVIMYTHLQLSQWNHLVAQELFDLLVALTNCRDVLKSVTMEDGEQFVRTDLTLLKLMLCVVCLDIPAEVRI